MRQTSCKHCGGDIEGPISRNPRRWHDRGGNTHCPTFCGYDQDGWTVEKPERLHEPWPLRYDADAKLPTREWQMGRYGYVEHLSQPR